MKTNFQTIQTLGCEITAYKPGYRMIFSATAPAWHRLYFPHMVFVVHEYRRRNFMQVGVSLAKPNLKNLHETTLIRLPVHGSYYGDPANSFMFCCRPQVEAFWTTGFYEGIALRHSPLISFSNWSLMSPKSVIAAFRKISKIKYETPMAMNLEKMLHYKASNYCIDHVNGL